MPPNTPKKDTNSSGPSVAKPSEVTRFFEKCGVLDALTRVFITMYEVGDEWPSNGTSYFMNLLSPTLSAQEEIDNMSEHIYRLRARVTELTRRNDYMRNRLRLHEMGMIEEEETPGPSDSEIQDTTTEVDVDNSVRR